MAKSTAKVAVDHEQVRDLRLNLFIYDEDFAISKVIYKTEHNTRK